GQHLTGWFRRIRFPWRRTALTEAMDVLIRQLDVAQQDEQRFLDLCDPDVYRLIRAAERREALLWYGSVEDHITLRLGSASLSSQSVEALRQQLSEHIQRLGWLAEAREGDSLEQSISSQLAKMHPEVNTILELCAEREQISLPYVVALERKRHYGFVIPGLSQRNSTLRALILDLALRYSPQVLSLELSGAGSHEYSEVHWLPHVTHEGRSSVPHTL